MDTITETSINASRNPGESSAISTLIKHRRSPPLVVDTLEAEELMEHGSSVPLILQDDDHEPSSGLPEEEAHQQQQTHSTTYEDAVKLCFGAAGIYLAYLSYGNMQENLFRFQANDGTKFRYVWFLQVLESLVNIGVGAMGRYVFGGTKGLPFMPFATSGVSQVFSKVFTSLSLAAGLSFPVCILTKSAKMVPVMLGQLILGDCRYTLKDYLIAAAIVGGTALLSLGESSSPSRDKARPSNTSTGMMFILLSLVFDGVTAGLQKRLKQDAVKVGLMPTPYDFMLFTNMTMAAVAMCIAFLTNDFLEGWAFVTANPAVFRMILTCCLCSAVGQSFIFFVVAHFDPLVCSTVTTTRKIMSVVWSITTKGHTLSHQGYVGLLVAVLALVLELHGKVALPSRRYQPKAYLED
jgi:UDP-galactose transporter B1